MIIIYKILLVCQVDFLENEICVCNGDVKYIKKGQAQGVAPTNNVVLIFLITYQLKH